MDYSLVASLDEETRRKLAELRQRHDRGEIRVEWSKAKEPDCVHSGWDGGVRPERRMQPASACRICKDSPELLAWRRYWNELLRSIP